MSQVQALAALSGLLLGGALLGGTIWWQSTLEPPPATDWRPPCVALSASRTGPRCGNGTATATSAAAPLVAPTTALARNCHMSGLVTTRARDATDPNVPTARTRPTPKRRTT